MAKSAIYSWRLAPEVKVALEHAVRRESRSVSHLLDRIVQHWLRDAGHGTGEEPEQALRLGWAHGALLTTFPGDTTMATVEQVRAFARGGSARIQR